MSPRWSWDFEDDPKPRPKAIPPVVPTGAPAAPAARRPPPRLAGRTVQVRRRRAGAIGAVLVLLVVAVAAASGSHSGHAPTGARGQAPAKAAKRPPTDPEKAEIAGVGSVLAYTPFAREGGTRGREIALTFDDGPGPYTPQVLSVLERFRVKATFFVVGKMLRYFGPSVVREIERGDAIGDHTESHPMLARLSAHDQQEELFETIARVELLGGHRPVLFRPPYGSYNATTLKLLSSLHLLMVLWSVDTGDYAQPGVSTIVERALAGAHPGAIILMHDAGGLRTQTIEALPLIIKGLQARGYQLVTVPRLMTDNPPPAGQQLPTNLSGA